MDDFDILIDLAKPALFIAKDNRTEGTTWRGEVLVRIPDPDTGELREPDMLEVSTLGTVEGKILSGIDGEEVAVLDVTVDGGLWSWEVDAADTAGTAGDSTARARDCRWYLHFTHPDGRKLAVWGVQDSHFVIRQGA